MAINIGQIQADYKTAFDEVGFDGKLLINTGPDAWAEHNVRMILRKASPQELEDPIYMDSMVVMFLGADLPGGVTKIKTRDRIRTNFGREMTFARGDLTKRSVQGVTMALEGVVKG